MSSICPLMGCEWELILKMGGGIHYGKEELCTSYNQMQCVLNNTKKVKPPTWIIFWKVISKGFQMVYLRFKKGWNTIHIEKKMQLKL